MASLQQLDAVDVVANLDQVSHQELGSPSLRPSGYLTTAHHVGLCQHCRVECPSVDTYMRGVKQLVRMMESLQTGRRKDSESVRVCCVGGKKSADEQMHLNVNSQADHKSECIDLRPHRLPLGYWTTMSWSSSMPHTVPVVVSVSNMPSVHPPWPCWRDWTISRSKSMLTRSPIWRPPGFLFPFCSPGRGNFIEKKIASDFKWCEINKHIERASQWNGGGGASAEERILTFALHVKERQCCSGKCRDARGSRVSENALTA